MGRLTLDLISIMLLFFVGGFRLVSIDLSVLCRHGWVVCLSECCHDNQPGEWVWNTIIPYTAAGNHPELPVSNSFIRLCEQLGAEREVLDCQWILQVNDMKSAIPSHQ